VVNAEDGDGTIDWRINAAGGRSPSRISGQQPLAERRGPACPDPHVLCESGAASRTDPSPSPRIPIRIPPVGQLQHAAEDVDPPDFSRTIKCGWAADPAVRGADSNDQAGHQVPDGRPYIYDVPRVHAANNIAFSIPTDMANGNVIRVFLCDFDEAAARLGVVQ
jgi:hypothetical protein